MTDEQIIKALECIAREEMKCAECAYGEYCYPVCQNLAGGDALNLIKSQKAEIERLKGNYDKAMDNLKSVLEERADHSEAIKDFAEIIISDYPEMEYYLTDLVKEMIGEQE